MAIKKSNTKNDEIKMNVIEKCGVISERSNGNTLELRLISWNGNPEKYDIRTWKQNEDGSEGCFKGITLTGEELIELKNIIEKLEEE